MTREELEFVVRHWTPQMQKAAAVDRGDRLELLNMALVNKKIAAEADAIGPDADPEAWWTLQYAIINRQRQFVQRHYMRTLEIPEMDALAEERYRTEKDKYALVPERRMSSHILVRCLPGPGQCVPKEKRAKAEKLLEELRGGADFDAMVAEHSDDPGAKKRGGRFDKWLRRGEPRVSPPYVQALFELEQVGDYSDVVQSQFGFHIIRLDEVEAAYYKPYEEVKDSIVATLRREYKELAAKDFQNQYLLTDDAVLDEAALEEIFAQYRPLDPVADIVADPNAAPETEPAEKSSE
jgi:parvulin-like peptidyl-prolyl isomerase